MNKDETKIEIDTIIGKYNALTAKDIKAYNEANTKQAFILPSFKTSACLAYEANTARKKEPRVSKESRTI